MKGLVLIAVLVATTFICAGCTDDTIKPPVSTAPTILTQTQALAETGNANAQFTLGSMYAEGKVIPNDFAEAAKWFRKAADQGHAQAQYFLGVIYSGGLSVPVDFTEAYTWYCLAAKSGFEGATVDCETLAVELQPDELVVANQRVDELFEETQTHGSVAK